MQKTRRLIQTKRIYELTAGRTALREKLLEIAERYPCFGGYLVRTEIRIAAAVLNDMTDACEQLVRMT
jgi:hypothetical protein